MNDAGAFVCQACLSQETIARIDADILAGQERAKVSVPLAKALLPPYLQPYAAQITTPGYPSGLILVQVVSDGLGVTLNDSTAYLKNCCGWPDTPIDWGDIASGSVQVSVGIATDQPELIVTGAGQLAKARRSAPGLPIPGNPPGGDPPSFSTIGDGGVLHFDKITPVGPGVNPSAFGGDFGVIHFAPRPTKPATAFALLPGGGTSTGGMVLGLVALVALGYLFLKGR